MIFVNCHTNIDCCQRLKWPTELPERPVVGDLIRSESSTRNKYIELEVVRCTWIKDYDGYAYPEKKWILNVELWMVKSRYENLSEFEKWVEGR